jgi:hypothetical protein
MTAFPNAEESTALGGAVRGQRLRLRLPIKNAQDVQRLLNALDAFGDLTAGVSTGATFRKRLAKKTDAQLTAFLDAARLVAKALEPLRRIPVAVEAEIAEP